MSQNIFYKVIKSENQISQLLVNLVNENEEIRNVLTKFLFDKPHESDFKIKSFDNQKRDEHGQPDIQFKIENNKSEFIGEVILEVKTQDSELTGKQKSEYKNKLLQSAGENKYLFFLIPKYYKHEKEIKESFSINSPYPVTCDIRYWHILVEKLRDKLDGFDSVLLTEIIEHLNDIFGFKNINLHFNQQQIDFMLTNEIPNTLYGLNKLIDSVSNYLKIKNSAWFTAYNEGGGSYGKGYGFFYNSIFFGYDFDLWQEKNAVLVISVHSSTGQAFNLFEFDDRFAKPVQYFGSDEKYIDLTQEIAKEKNVDHIIEIIDDFSNRLNSSH